MNRRKMNKEKGSGRYQWIREGGSPPSQITNELAGHRIHVDDEKLLEKWVSGRANDWARPSRSEPSLRSHNH
jgi:hypothetical protein